MAGDEEEFCYRLERALSDLKEKAFKISLKEEQRQALEQLYVKKKDLVAILTTGFGKKFNLSSAGSVVSLRASLPRDLSSCYSYFSVS